MPLLQPGDEVLFYHHLVEAFKSELFKCLDTLDLMPLTQSGVSFKISTSTYFCQCEEQADSLYVR